MKSPKNLALIIALTTAGCERTKDSLNDDVERRQQAERTVRSTYFLVVPQNAPYGAAPDTVRAWTSFSNDGVVQFYAGDIRGSTILMGEKVAEYALPTSVHRVSP